MAELKEGDWCVYGLVIVQIMAVEPYLEYSTGFIRGMNASREDVRPLTLKAKIAVESMKHYYEQLREIDGNSGFNYPRISDYFAQLALDVIDGNDDVGKAAYDKAQKFVRAARDYQKVIDGVPLFRPK